MKDNPQCNLILIIVPPRDPIKDNYHPEVAARFNEKIKNLIITYAPYRFEEKKDALLENI